MPSHRGRSSNLGVLLLASQMFGVGFDNIPPVTLVTICAQVAIFLRLVNLPWNIRDICISADTVLNRRQWKRLVISTFDHADDMHLYYNMVSFLWKGLYLERKYGSKKFGVIIATFSVLCSLTYVALSELASRFLEDPSYSYQCAVGFSGVLFALKVLANQSSGEVTYVSGFPVSTKWACWFELVLIHLLVPNASFIGHLAGILVGLAYVHGPLKPLISILYRSL